MMDDLTTYTVNGLSIMLIRSLSEEVIKQCESSYGDVLPEEFSLLFSKSPRAQFKEIDDDTMLIIMRTVLFKTNEDDTFLSLRMMTHKNKVYIVCEHDLEALKGLSKLSNKVENSFEVICYLLDAIMRELEEHIYEIEELVEDLEEALIDEVEVNTRLNVLSIRRKVVELRKHLLPQREVMSRISHSVDSSFQSSSNTIFDLYQKSLRICDNLDAMRERLGLMQEEISTIINDRMNQNMYRLSIVATIFLPLGFITGLLGVNVAGMPGTKDNASFWLVVLGCSLIGVGIWLYFKYKKWLF